MLSSILIIGFSLVLFIYWFRYTCLLILRADPEEKSSARVAVANHLKFPDVQARLEAAVGSQALDPLWRSLENDYRILRYLLDHGAGLGLPAIEQALLLCDYQIMKLWYRLTRNASASQARQALHEMSSIVCYLSRRIGEGSAYST
jgi:hypothetical protein